MARRLAGTGGAIGAVVLAIALWGTSIAYAASTYTLDPVLSLTGSCKTTPKDPVEDPGCPGGVHLPNPSSLRAASRPIFTATSTSSASAKKKKTEKVAG